MSSPSNRLQFTDLYLTTMLPALDHFIFEELGRRGDQYVKFFNIETIGASSGGIMQVSETAGLGLFQQVGEGSNVRYDAPIQAFNKTYTPVQWASGFRTTKRMVDDDKFGLVKGLAKALGDAARETIEVQCATVFNNAFTTTGPDGKVLCATDHPLVGGGTQANRPVAAVDLDIPSLEAGLTNFRTFVDHRGKKVRNQPRWLVIPPALEFAAVEILKSNMRSDTANNTINAFQNRLDEPTIQPAVYEYLTDDDTWFITGDPARSRRRVVWREKPFTVHDVDFDSLSAKTAMWFVFDVGFDGYEDVYGVPGA